MTNEKTPRLHQVAMAEALGGTAIIGDSTEFVDTNKKAFGFEPADGIAQSNADRYDLTHPIIPATDVEPVKISVVDILKSDGVDEIVKADEHVEVPSLLLASDSIVKSEATSKPDSDFVEMEIDGIMKLVPRN